MWLFYAISSAFFAGMTSILAKCGIRKTDSTVATAVVVIAAGIFLMIEKKDVQETKSGRGGWFLYAAGSAFFASLIAILGKIGISGVESNLGTAIRTCAVLVVAWVMVLVTGKQGEVKKIGRKELLFICCSGVATGASWVCYYRALQEGPAGVVAPIDKLSVLVTVAFSYFVFGENHEPGGVKIEYGNDR